MADQRATGYLSGDPQYGLSGESLKDYYRTEPAQRVARRMGGAKRYPS
jgi:hypothetical protein